ncbi:MAG: haloacid dehalogenase-like hydrolase [Chitinophagaceae bacterium]|jgi:HAD superfamily hydrolase (TIGR01490 family)|nr:MAG: haloacid dehalogenase-like hydrolase [Chitinophagaceae bacterium]
MPEEYLKTLALFDFDGTLTRKDTFLELIKFVHGKNPFYKGILKLAPYLFLFKIKVLPNWKVKEKVLIHFFKGMPYDLFQDHCNRFAMEIIPTLMRKDALTELEKLQSMGTRIIIVSASSENWILPWSNRLKIECIASKMEIAGGTLTGKLSGKNCYGMEKVIRIKETTDLSKYSVIYAFGDSKGDLPMLKLATKPFYRTFKK